MALVSNAIATATSDPLLVVGLIVALLIAWWLVGGFMAADDEDEFVEEVGARAQRTASVGGTATRAGVVGLAGIGAALSTQLLQLGVELNAVLGGAPVLLGHMLFGVFTLLGIRGLVPFGKPIAGLVFMFVTAIALILRFSRARGGEMRR